PFGYTGYSFDGIADTYFAQARQYDPTLGRFAGADPHWNTWSMIYGDSNFILPDPSAIKQSSNLYVYCLSDPLQYVDALGMWGDPVHHDDTLSWALGLEKSIPINVARVIANADKGIDATYSGTNALPSWVPIVGGQPGLHFNAASNPTANIDTRIAAAHNDLDYATNVNTILVQNKNNAIKALGSSPSAQDIRSINAEFERQQYDYVYVVAGQGLHSMQDMFAHGNKGIAGVDQGHLSGSGLFLEGVLGGPFALLFNDEALARVGVNSHIFNSNNQFDNPDYDWSDCSLTKVQHSGHDKAGNYYSTRYQSTKLASEGYLASTYYEFNKP
ncbi:MAG: hypothetical protein FWF45_01385, partial [Coriobacteriia bacterium]|nr:hypothetical protein [Coriobacteriia bacterium]